MDTHSDGVVVETDAWKLVVPRHVTADSPVICIPTVHPRGDRRIVRCAQVALDAGFRLSFIWLGEGVPSDHPAIQEQLLPTPGSARERILATRAVARAASDVEAALWHIHDYYMLAQGRRWHRRCGRPVVYDVHEYYGDYYASKFPLPARFRRILANQLDRYQARMVAGMGGANLVAADMSPAFERRGVPISTCPNFPSIEQFREDLVAPFAERSADVVYTGSLTRSYGMEMLVALAARAHERGDTFRFRAISRFPSEDARTDFARLVSDAGNPPNLTILEPMASHEIPSLLAQSGFGLSLLHPSDPQFEIAVNSKNYEYAVMGIVVVATNGAALKQFVSQFAVGTTANSTELDTLLDSMKMFATEPADTDAKLRMTMATARRYFTWEGQCAPELTNLYERVLNTPTSAGRPRLPMIESN